MSLAEEIREALNRGEIFVVYMPTIMLVDGRCVGAEALVRWRRPRSVLPAEAFIPLIENTPASGMITYWVIDTVSAELGAWLGAHPQAHLSINVPPEILGRGGLAYAAARSGLHARVDQIVLEITERGVPDRLGLDALKLIAERGVRLALDDTALNGVNLALLTRCNFGVVKLDRALIRELQPGAPQPEWVGGLASLLKTSSLQVVAEGVESDYQADAMRAIGVQMAQGHLFSMPLTARGLMDLYARDHGQEGANAVNETD